MSARVATGVNWMSGNSDSSSGRGSYFCVKCWRRHIFGKSDGNRLWKGHRDHALTLPEEFREPIADACLSTQKTREELLTEYLRRGLEGDGIEVDGS